MPSFPLSLSQWKYRRAITINNTSNSNNLTDYQVLVTLDTQSLISAGKMRNDGGDIRFADGATLLNYWIESGINTTSTKIWVKVPSIPANSTKTIYVYYGNSSATSESNGDNTFLFFDDFPTATLNTTKWNLLANGTPVTSPVWEGTYSVQANNTGVNNNNLKSNYNLSNIGMAIDFMFYDNGFTSSTTNIWSGFLDTNGYLSGVGVVTGSYSYYSYNYDNTNGSMGVSRSVGWHFGSVKRTSSQVIVTVDNSTVTINYANTFSYIAFYSIQGTGWWDVIRVRKYTSPEPTTSVGTEEKRLSIIPLIFIR
jgi:hypothetical protein